MQIPLLPYHYQTKLSTHHRNTCTFSVFLSCTILFEDIENGVNISTICTMNSCPIVSSNSLFEGHSLCKISCGNVNCSSQRGKDNFLKCQIFLSFYTPSEHLNDLVIQAFTFDDSNKGWCQSYLYLNIKNIEETSEVHSTFDSITDCLTFKSPTYKLEDEIQK